ncbi:MAG: hypothetical protein M0Q92_08845 [Methanoregula sp.]|jgi:hypothetical protein|nr:hypothetical protein [Methanoregula sp.]
MTNKDKNNVDIFTVLYDKGVEPDHLIPPFIKGHLMVEFLLRKLIEIHDPLLKNLSENLSHQKLIQLNFEINNIDKKQKNVLTIINKIRNKFSHDITYSLTLNELKQLFKLASQTFSDMTDGISQGMDKIKHSKNIDEINEWAISELFVQISYDLHDIYQSKGGHFESF